MKLRTITLNLEGKTEGDLELALEEALSKIKSGYLTGMDSNDSGAFSFDVKNQAQVIKSDDITSEAKHIASQLPGTLTEQELCEFATDSNGMSLDSFDECIEGDFASMIQVMIDERGGVDNDGDEDVTEKLNEYFNCPFTFVALRHDKRAMKG